MNLLDYYSHTYLKNQSILHRKSFTIPRKKLLFIDRDGVLIEDVNYISSKDQVLVLDNIFLFLEKARSLNYDICVVTNQSSVSRSIINIEQYIEITKEFLLKIPSDLYPDFILASFHLPYSTEPGCNWRKPGIGMFKFMIDNFSYCPSDCLMFGDKLTDLIPAYKIGIKKLYFIKSSLHKDESKKVSEWKISLSNNIILSESDNIHPDLLN